MNKKIFLLAVLFLLTPINISAQMPTREEWERLQKESGKDHALMMKMLGISEIRPPFHGRLLRKRTALLVNFR